MAAMERVVRLAGVPEGFEPAWEVALFYPAQGDWTEEEYLSLPDENRAELSEGRIEALPIPTVPHQLTLFMLARLLADYVEGRALGVVLPSGTPVRLGQGKFRQPDVVFMPGDGMPGQSRKYWQGAGLVMEIVGDDAKDRERDLVTKRAEYAKAGIPEYWIVDPQEERIVVLVLEGEAYRVHGEFHRGEEATSVLLPGFAVSVDAVMKSATG